MKQLFLRLGAPLITKPSSRYFAPLSKHILSAARDTPSWNRPFSSSNIYRMSDLKVDLTAPNGRKISLPTGLFINNEFVKATGGQTITSINPT